MPQDLFLVVDQRYTLVIVLLDLGRCRLRSATASLLLHGNPTVVRTAHQDDADARSVEDADRGVEDDGRQQDHEHLLDVGSDAQGEGAGELVADQARYVERERHDAGGNDAEGGPQGNGRAELGGPPGGD